MGRVGGQKRVEAIQYRAAYLPYLMNRDITAKWTLPIQNWACILTQLAIRFESRLGA